MSAPDNPNAAPAAALNKAMLEAVDFVHAEGWDAAPTLFALVNSSLLVDQLDGLDEQAPLTLVVQELPEHIQPGSEELADYVSRLTWPAQVSGVVLAQEIMFRDVAEESGRQEAAARPARLFSGVLRANDFDAEGPSLTLLQLRPSEEEIAAAGPFAEDKVELRGGPGVAPGVIAALRYGLEATEG